MKRAAVDQARNRLEKARRALADMKNSRLLDATASAWSNFLVASSGVYSKLEQGAKGAGLSEAWFGRKKHERRTDRLLQYIHQARNADEHGIEPITRAELASLQVSGGGAYRFDGIVGGDDTNLKITHEGGPPPVVLVGRRMKLTTVKDSRYGDSFDPPAEHLGAPISDRSPIGVASLALSYLEGLLAEAAQLAE